MAIYRPIRVLIAATLAFLTPWHVADVCTHKTRHMAGIQHVKQRTEMSFQITQKTAVADVNRPTLTALPRQ